MLKGAMIVDGEMVSTVVQESGADYTGSTASLAYTDDARMASSFGWWGWTPLDAYADDEVDRDLDLLRINVFATVDSIAKTGTDAQRETLAGILNDAAKRMAAKST